MVDIGGGFFGAPVLTSGGLFFAPASMSGLLGALDTKTSTSDKDSKAIGGKNGTGGEDADRIVSEEEVTQVDGWAPSITAAVQEKVDI